MVKIRGMKITLALVSSVDGKTTKWNSKNTSHWSSKEDQKHFYTLLGQYSLILMGSKTYEAAKHLMTHKNGTTRIVLTHNPKKYQKEIIPGQLEFTSEAPLDLIKRLKKLGYKQALIVGGAITNTAFFKVNLITEVLLTVEPKLFGIGNSLLGNGELDIDMKLVSVEKLNSKGTLLLKYKVLK